MSTALDELNIWAVMALLLRRRLLVFGFPVAVGLLVAIISLMQPRVWQASASFIAQESSTPSGGLGALASTLGISAGGMSGSNSPQFYTDLVKSRSVLSRVVAMRHPTSPDGKDSVDLYAHYEIARTDPMAAVRVTDRLRKAIIAAPDAKTGVVHFDVKDSSATVAASIASGILRTVDEFNRARRRNRAGGEREFAESRLRIAQDSLAIAQRDWADFQRRNRVYHGSPELEAEADRLQNAVQMRQMLFTSLVQNAEAARQEEFRNTSTIAVLDDPNGFVELKPRGIPVRTIGAVFVAAILAFSLAFLLEYARLSRESGSPGLAEIDAFGSRIMRRKVAARAE
jgi:uncharacterized protein involved in exopolysaccharide biosynthesis